VADKYYAHRKNKNINVKIAHFRALLQAKHGLIGSVFGSCNGPPADLWTSVWCSQYTWLHPFLFH